MPYNSGAVATERYKMPVPVSSRFTTSSYRSGISDRPYYSSSTSTYSRRSPATSEYRSSYSTLASRTSSLPTHTRQSSLPEEAAPTKRTTTSREPSETRDPTSTAAPRTTTRRTVSTNSVSDADFYSKYSPANYVPNAATSSAAATDIGRPPFTCEKPSTLRSRSTKNAVNEVTRQIGGCSTLERRIRQVSITDLEDADSSAAGRARAKKNASKEDKGLTGLVNIGNTCFMNSVVQCLSNTKPLLDYLLADAYVSELNHNSAMKGKLISAFSEMVKELWSGSGSVASPVAFKAQISKYAPRFTGYSQQDAQEFLRFLLEGVHEDVNRVKTKPRQLSDAPEGNASPDQKAVDQWKRYLRQDDSKIVDLFVGQLRSTLRCSVCGHASVTFDPFWDLQLPIPSRTGQLRLQQCLDHFTTEEVLDGNEKAFCAQCSKNQKSTKSFTIQKFPKILVLQLNRFSPTDRYRRKLSVTVDFPLDHLDLSHYSAVPRTQPSTYELYGVSNHSGSPSFGHYTAYCRHPTSGQWHEYNDSRVSSISARSVVSSEAYLLFYELSSRTSHL